MNILAIDQSFTHTGLAVVSNDLEEGKIIALPTCIYPKWVIDRDKYGTDSKCKPTKKDKRLFLVDRVNAIIRNYQPSLIVVERVRTFAHGKISIDTVKALHGLVVAIVDATDIPVVCVDTRAWKNKELGNPSASKEDAVKHILACLEKQEEQGAGVQLDNKLDHDTADAACMAKAVIRGLKNDPVE